MTKTIAEDIKERFRAIDFFRNCGGDVELPFQVDRVSDWDAASQHFCDPEWENTTLEASNELTEFLHENFIEQYRDWNDYADAGRAFINDELLEGMESWQSSKNLDSVFVDCVKWDLLHALLFQQYKVELSGELPDFYGKLLSVYETGHYPCGWSDAYPDGVLVII
ncbi:hypothetical protein [Litoribrevibacter albus]|uniref:Uncharacterized protein n=1 Tax=Litoribrevibacter albus TaxID=1473156 RepID=A0AA37S7V6_9GAMM|nr:hypothetical protein [Litoribrevibacter albus]GLQ30008.1 hypothetical protein GCM10007876_04860 [Litoribrevibacter albus]